MEFYNRRLLLLNEDVPISKSISPFPQIQPNASSPSISITIPMTPSSSSSSTKTFTPPLQLPFHIHPIFSPNIAYTFLLLFSTLFFFFFVVMSIRELSYRRRRFLKKGLDVDAVKALPVVEYKEDVKQLECVICLEEFEECDFVKMIPFCEHVFHPECIDMWLSAHVTCPICRCVIMNLHGGRSTAENRSSD